MSEERKSLAVAIHLKDQSQPIVYVDVLNTYEKGSFYCVYLRGEWVYKHPIADIWRIVEDYGYHGRDEERKEQK